VTTSHPPHERYPHVFDPIRLGPVEIPNRIYMAPHGLPLDTPIPGLGSHGEPSAEHAFYFAERAAGGTGLIFHSTLLGPFADIANYIHATPGIDEAIPSYAKVAELVHDQGAKIMAEIWYLPWVQHKWDALGPSAPSLAPSATPFFDGTIPATMYKMNEYDIQHVVEAHGKAAAGLRSAGYDGVELHLSHGSLLEYFLSGHHNHRDDQYGGSVENRCRIILQALESTRAAAGPDMAVGVRMNADQMLPNGFGEDEARTILERLTASSFLDFVDLDISVEPEQQHLTTTGYLERELHNLERIQRVGPAVKPLPLLATPGRLTGIDRAEQMLADGTADMVGIVRGLIAEPQLVKNAESGSEHRSRICIGANHCIHNNAASQGWGCAINPVAGREERWREPGEREQRGDAMNVVVVGAGPAGLEAARISAQRGHNVTLLEREPWIGGALRLWGSIPGRSSVLSLPSWFAARLTELNVDIRTGVDANVSAIAALKPDVVIIATGARYETTGVSGRFPAPIPGHAHTLVHRPEPILRGEVELRGKVFVLDEEGLHTGVGVAEVAAASGAVVEFITSFPMPGMNIGHDMPYVFPRFRNAGIAFSPLTTVTQIESDRLTLTHTITGEERVVSDVAALVLTTYRQPRSELVDPLADVARYVYVIGDALAPRTLREATYEGHRFGRAIGDADMPQHTTDEMFKPLNALRPASSISA
jgi:2,4-dienoyl-CoA reductase-like NADH-dependent reductase (Old Yellow Enzyme family)